MSKRSIRSGYVHVPSQAHPEGGALRLPAIGRTARQALLLGTALGCSIAVFSLSAPGMARAANECGPLVASGGVDQVTCAPGGYPSGITYIDSGGNPVVVTLGAGADPGGPSGVFVENQSAGAYAGVIIDYNASVFASVGSGVGAYTSAGGDVFVKNYGSVDGFGTNAIYADAINGGNVYVYSDGYVLGKATLINAKTSAGSVDVNVTGVGEVISGYSGTTTDIKAYAVGGFADVTVGIGGVYLHSGNGYAVGVNSASTFDNTTKIYGGVNVAGYSGALGVKTSSAYAAATTVYGDVNVSSGYAGKGGGNATGVISVGSYKAYTYVGGNVTVTAHNGVALGVESSSLDGSYVTVEGGVSATGDLGATAVYARAIYDHNVGVYVGGDVSASSSLGTATGVFAVGGNTVANAGTYVDVTVAGGVSAHGYTQAIGVEAENLGGAVSVDVGGDVNVTATQGAAIGIESVVPGSYDNTVTVGGNVYAKGGTGAYGVVAEGGNIYVGITGDVTAIATSGNAVGVFSYGDNTVHIGGNVNVTASGNAYGVEVGGADGYAYVGGNAKAVSTGAGNARAIYGNATGDVGVHVGGDVYAAAGTGTAIGVFGYSSAGNVSIYVGGDVYAKSTAGGAGGAIAEGLAGSADITIEGNVVARGYSIAIGAEVAGSGNIHIGGDVGAYSPGAAYGVAIEGVGGYAYVGGNVRAISTVSGNVRGVYGNVSGDFTGHVDGNIYVASVDSAAIGIAGISTGGNVTLYVGGDVYAKSTTGGAGGAIAEGLGGTADITVNGNIVVHGYTEAIGAEVYGSGNVHIGGDVGAFSSGAAYGVAIVGVGGYAYVGGNIVAVSSVSGNVRGLYGNVSGDFSGHVDGSIYAKSVDDAAIGAAGISTGGNVTLYVGGDIEAISTTGGAGGAIAEGLGGTADITVGGNIVVHGYTEAIGAEVYGSGNVHIGGDVGAFSSGAAYGVAIVGVGGYAYVGGNIVAVSSVSGNVRGLYGNVSGDFSGHVDGSIYAKSVDDAAIGAAGISTGGNVTLYVGGDIEAISTTGGAGGAIAEGLGGTADITVGGNIVVHGYTEAIGAEVYGSGNVHIGGDVGAFSSGAAYGVAIVGVGGYAYVGGNIVAVSSVSGNVRGLYGNVSGDFSGHVDGSIYAKSVDDAAIGAAGISTGGNVTLYVGGDIEAISTTGGAGGAIAEGLGGTADITVNGNIVVHGYTEAIGAEVYGSGNVHIGGDVGAFSSGAAYGVAVVGVGGYAYVGGNIVAVSSVSGNVRGLYGNVSGDFSGHVDGSIYAKSVDDAAIGAAGISTGGNVTLYVGGDIEAISTTGGAGGAIAEGLGGAADITVNGNIVVHGYTEAIGAEVYGSGNVHIGGDVGAFSSGAAYGVAIVGVGGYAYVGGNIVAVSSVSGNVRGLYGNVSGDFSGHVDGSIYAKSVDDAAIGAAGISTGGNVTLYVGGDIEAESTTGAAGGVIAGGNATNSITVGGNVTAVGYTEAIGAAAVGGDISIDVGGNVSAFATTGYAIGVYANTTGYIDARVDGTVMAYSKEADAIGAKVIGDSSIYIGGNAVAIAPLGNATAVTITSSGNAYVHVVGNVYAGGDLNATGVYNHAVDYSSTLVGGDVYAKALTGDAMGVYGYSETGAVYVGVGGSAIAVAYVGNATGIHTVSVDDTNISVGGDVAAIAVNGTAYGINASTGTANVTITVGGNVIASGENGAVGVSAESAITGGAVDVTVDGNVGAATVNGNAIGVLDEGGHANVTVGGNVSAYSVTGVAVGIEAVAEYGVTVSVGGNVYSRSVSGAGAIGVIAESAYDVNIGVGGVTEVIGNVAYGVFGESVAGGNVTVDVGDVTIHQYGATTPYQGAGVITYTTGVTNITAGHIYTTGDFTDGIRAGRKTEDNGDTYITLTSVETTGDYSPGVYVYGPGNATINSGTAYTKGYKSDGLYAVSTLGGVNVTSTMVKTLGDYSAGIYAKAGGPVVVTSGTSVTYGYKADAVVAINTGTTATDTVAVYSGNAITHGNDSVGIYASGYNSTYVKSGLVVTYGANSDGIFALSTNGPVTVVSGMVHTYYTSSDGIVGETTNGNVSITSNIVLTDGDFSTGIDAVSLNGSASVDSTYVRTLGFASDGIFVHAGGDASVTSYAVKTYGEDSYGIDAYSLNGNTTVNSTFVYTAGNYSTGIYAGSHNGNVTVTSGSVITEGPYAYGIKAYSYNGTTSVNSAYVRTNGYAATGIYAYGFEGVTVDSGTVRTYGDYADGILAISNDGQANVTSNYVVTHGNYSPGISAYGYFGATVHNTGLVKTYGYRSDGIDASAYAGNVTVTSNEVVTYGDYSKGISARALNGDTSVSVTGGVFTYGYAAPGVYAVSFNGNASVYSEGFIRTAGAYSDGIFAGAFGNAYIDNEGVIATYGYGSVGAFAESIGADTVAEVVNGGDIYAYDSVGILAESNGGYAEVFNFGRVYGEQVGVLVESTEGSYIYNKGAIYGGNGFAIEAYGAPVYIENKGSIFGYARLYTSNNTVDNHGRWFAYGNSYFGYGNDTFNNHGIVEVAPFSGTATTVTWSGLTVFNNSNLVDLRNGHTGDVFNLVGNGGVGTVWNGLAGSTLGVDASLSTVLTSDLMNVGAVNGSTALVVNDTTPSLPGALNFVGTTVAHGTSGTASNFTWVGRTKGFINYELQFFSGPVDWNIVALPSNAAFELLKAPEMAQDFWRRTGDAWSAREQEVRDSMWGSSPPTRGEGWEMWAQAQVGGERLDRTESFDVQGMSFSPNLSTDTDWRGFQMGGDNWTSKNWLWGFTGGFLEQNTSFHFDKNSFDITGWNAGVYTGFTSGAFFMNGLLKGDWFDLKANMHTVPALETFSGNTWGAKGEMGFRFGSPHLYLEPLADLAWTSTHMDNANFASQDTVFTFGNATSLRGSIGARIGGQMGSILPYVGLYAAQEFDGKNKMAMITGGGCSGCEMDVQDLKPGSYERADFGFTTTSWNGLEGFLKGEAEFGGHTNGFTGRLGVRWRW